MLAARGYFNLDHRHSHEKNAGGIMLLRSRLGQRQYSFLSDIHHRVEDIQLSFFSNHLLELEGLSSICTPLTKVVSSC